MASHSDSGVVSLRSQITKLVAVNHCNRATELSVQAGYGYVIQFPEKLQSL